MGADLRCRRFVRQAASFQLKSLENTGYWMALWDEKRTPDCQRSLIARLFGVPRVILPLPRRLLQPMPGPTK